MSCTSSSTAGSIFSSVGRPGQAFWAQRLHFSNASADKPGSVYHAVAEGGMFSCTDLWRAAMPRLVSAAAGAYQYGAGWSIHVQQAVLPVIM